MFRSFKPIPAKNIQFYLENEDKIKNGEISLTAVCKNLGIDRHQIVKISKNGYRFINGKYFYDDDRLKKFLSLVDYYNENKHSFSHKQMLEDTGVSSRTFFNLYKEFFNEDLSLNITSSKKIEQYNRSVFKSIDTEEKAYWLGFILADGYLFLNKSNNSKRVVIKLGNKDKDHLIKFIKFLNGSIEELLKTEVNHVTGNVLYKVVLQSKEIYDDLQKYGLRQGKSCKEVVYKDIDPSLLPHYIRGIYDGDGHLSFTYNRIELVGGYNELLWIRKTLMKETGIKKQAKIAKAGSKNDSGLKRLSYYHEANIICEYLYKNAIIYLDRKYETAMQIINHGKNETVCL